MNDSLKTTNKNEPDSSSTKHDSTTTENESIISTKEKKTVTKKKKKSKLQSFKTFSDAAIKSRYSVRSSTSSISIKSTHHHHHHHHHPTHWLTSFPSPSITASAMATSNKKKLPKKPEADEFWSTTSSSEERQKIREFWLQLGEEERRSLVKVEKEAVLRKMKDQQKHGCNCSVCGKKR
ncbi:stress response protein NST1 [Cunninghamella echinulata]|nr:stress response protein NST1 [Cunninghamella echinulata]